MAKDKATIQTPGYIKSLLLPPEGRSADRRAWSIPIAGVWVPFFTATNAVGETAIPSEVLGAPLRLAKESDGTPKFSKSGRPVLRVVKDLSDQVRIVRENFTSGLLAYVGTVQKGMSDAYKAQVDMAHKAGEPIQMRDYADLTSYLESLKDNGASAPTEAEKELVAA